MAATSINFYHSLFGNKSKIPSFVGSVHNIKDDSFSFQPSKNDKEAGSVCTLRLIPDYVAIKVKKNWGSRQITQENVSYALNLTGFDSVEACVKNRHGKNARQIFKKKKRLEACLNISYKKFFGEIGEEEYGILMSILEKMLVVRFKQRNDTNEVLASWEELTNRLLNLIRAEQASLFVVYDNENPIQISIQHHFGKVMRAAITSYDIDYEKFSLGNLALYEQVKWCLAHGYEILDQGYGDLEYKRRWSNYIYNFKLQVCYPKQFSTIIIGNWVYAKAFLKEFLKSKGVHDALAGLKKRFSKQKDTGENDKGIDNFKILEEQFNEDNSLKEIDFNSVSGLKKITNDFLYATVEHVDNVKLFEVLNEKNTYFLKGKNKAQKFYLLEG